MAIINEKKESSEIENAAANIFRNHYKAVIVIAFFLILALGFLFLIFPKYKKINDDIAIMKTQKETQYEQASAYQKELNELVRSYKVIPDENKEKINNLLSDKQDSEELYAALEKMIESFGLVVNNIAIDWPQEVDIPPELIDPSLPKTFISDLPPQVGAAMINLTFSGADYQTFKLLLKSFEENLRIFDIEKVAFEPNFGATNLTMYAYYLK